jgi:hypothetical protein
MLSIKTKVLPDVGETILVDDIERTVTSIERNKIGEPIICWESPRGIGACMVSIWLKWEKEKTDPYRNL